MYLFALPQIPLQTQIQQRSGRTLPSSTKQSLRECDSDEGSSIVALYNQWYDDVKNALSDTFPSGRAMLRSSPLNCNSTQRIKSHVFPFLHQFSPK